MSRIAITRQLAVDLGLDAPEGFREILSDIPARDRFEPDLDEFMFRLKEQGIKPSDEMRDQEAERQYQESVAEDQKYLKERIVWQGKKHINSGTDCFLRIPMRSLTTTAAGDIEFLCDYKIGISTSSAAYAKLVWPDAYNDCTDGKIMR